MSLNVFARHFTNGTKPLVPITGLVGRFIRGKNPSDFETLTDDLTRKIVMLVDSDGLHDTLGLSGYDTLVRIGYMPDYIRQKVVDEGLSFKLVVFQEGGNILPATWDNIPAMISAVYPGNDGIYAAQMVSGKLSLLKAGRFDAWNDEYRQRYGRSMSEIVKIGPADLGYFTLERFLRGSGSAWEARAFLYFTLHLRELFAGDGYTYENTISAVTRGLREYFCPNVPISELGDYRLLGLTVQVPVQSPTVRKGSSVSQNLPGLPLPSFYTPDDCDKVYQERAGVVASDAATYAKRHNIQPASKDTFKIAAFGIDCQIGFCTPGASLFVPGAVEDTKRTASWLYRNLDKLTGLHFSMDTHRVYQIFHPAMWIASDGNHPDPFTIITFADVKAGKWMPVHNPVQCMEYVKKLESGGKFQLMIWPFHTMLGGVSHALVPAIMEAAIFHSVARRMATHFETKGTHSMTENYSVLEPEVTELGGQPVGGFNTKFFQMLMDYDRIYVFGQAKSHCVLHTLKSMQDEIEKTDSNLMKKVYILEDAMSSVTPPPLNPLPPELNFPVIADAFMADMKTKGMHIVKTTDLVLV